MEKAVLNEQELLSLIVTEVKEAREVYELVKQFEGSLPLKDFKDIQKVVGKKGLKFRDIKFNVNLYEDIIPEIIFPIVNMKTLVILASELVHMVPPNFGLDMSKVENVKRHLRRFAMLGERPNGSPNNSLSFGGMARYHVPRIVARKLQSAEEADK